MPEQVRPKRKIKPAWVIIALLAVVLASAGGALLGTRLANQSGAPTLSAALPCAPNPADAKIVDQSAMGQLAALNGTGTGRGYADMSFVDKDGKPVKLSDFAGKTLLVNFWASWCVPCRAEMPALDKVAAKYNDDKFMVLPINLDLGPSGMDKAKAFIAQGGFTHLPLYADPTFDAFKQLQTSAVATGLPTTLLLDRKGCELGVLPGPAAWDSPDGDDVIKALKSI